MEESKALYTISNVTEVELLIKIRMDFAHVSKGSIYLLARKHSVLWGRIEQ